VAARNLTRRPKVRGDAPSEIGMNAPSGQEFAALLRDMKKLGVSHCGVRSRSCDELIDQIQAFGKPSGAAAERLN